MNLDLEEASKVSQNALIYAFQFGLPRCHPSLGRALCHWLSLKRLTSESISNI